MKLNELIQPKGTKASFTFGRFNPPTKGHSHLLNVVKKAAGTGDHYVFTGRTNDKNRNPLRYEDKITLMRAMFPTINIVDDPNVKNPWQALEELGKHYDDVTLVVGSDRQQDFQSQMRPYMKEFGIKNFQVISSGERDADSTDVQGISATKARAFARVGDFKSFSQTVDGGETLKKELYNKVRQGMGVTESKKPVPPKKSNPIAKQLTDPKFRPQTVKDKKKEIDKGYVKHKGKAYDINEAYIMDLNQNQDLLVLRVKDTDKKGHIEVRGKKDYETDGYDPKDPLHKVLDQLDGATVSRLYSDEKVVLNPKNPRTAPTIKKAQELMKEQEPSKPIVYVDMDGVLANFFEEYAKLAGVKSGNYKDIPPAKTDPTLNKMVGTDFFNRLPKFPTADKLLQLVTSMFGSYSILSAPLRGDHQNSTAQKHKWIQRELAIKPDNIIIVGRKDSYATQADGTPNILIDDRGRNIEAWRNRGGLGVKYQADEDPLSKVEKALTEFKGQFTLKEWGGKIVKGINTTADVGVNQIPIEAKKLGFKVTKDGVPPIMQPKNMRRVKRMKEALIKINGSNKELTLQQQIDLLEITKGIRKVIQEKKAKKIKKGQSNPAEVPYQNDAGTMSLLTHPGTEFWQKMKASSKPGTDEWFKTWKTLSYLTKGRKNHYMLPIKEELEKLLVKYKIIKESDVADLQQAIAKRVSSVTDPALLNKIASMLRRSNIGNISRMAFKQDEDAAKFINRLSEIIVAIEVPINDKIAFLRKFGRSNFIKPEVLFDNSGAVHSMDDWWEGTGFATTMFKLMINDPQLQGKSAGESGPGEVAIACFHKKISVGSDPSAGYDLKWGSQEIEVKTKASEKSSSGGGRWTAYDGAPLETYLQSGQSLLDPEKVPTGVRATKSSRAGTQISFAEVLNNPQYLKDPNTPLTQQQQKEIFAKVLKQAYQSAPNEIINTALANYPNVTDKDIAQAAFASYKVKQGFQSMLLMKASGGGISTIHFSELDKGIDNFKVNGPYVRGQKQRGMDVQATLR